MSGLRLQFLMFPCVYSRISCLHVLWVLRLQILRGISGFRLYAYMTSSFIFFAYVRPQASNIVYDFRFPMFGGIYGFRFCGGSAASDFAYGRIWLQIFCMISGFRCAVESASSNCLCDLRLQIVCRRIFRVVVCGGLPASAR